MLPDAQQTGFEWTQCDHAWEVRRRVIASGVVIAGRQCLTCGAWDSKGIRKASIPDFDARPLYDEKLADAYDASRRAEWNRYLSLRDAERDRVRDERRAAWFEAHDRYLRSPEWRAKADKVLKRADYVCEACLERPATQVHHVTYDHWREEPLFDLRAVCRRCHEAITETDRARREQAG